MAQQEEIVLWIDQRWKNAIEKHLRDETLQEHLENVLDELCNQLPEREYARISRAIQSEAAAQRAEEEAARTYAAYHVTERGQEWYFKTSPGEELLAVGKKLRGYITKDNGVAPGKFIGMFFGGQPITAKEFDALTALRMENTGKVRGVFDVNFDKREFSAVHITVAAHQLGKFYRDDLSTLRDHEKAEQWFRCSAEAGNDFSEYALGKLLLTQKRTVEALEWLDKAAEQDNQFARYRLGKIYLTGEPVPKDVEKALAYLTASADQGNQFAQYALGKLYLLGRDVPPDREQAKEWLIRAAAQGNEYARFFLDRFDQFRDPSVMLAATKLLHHMSSIFQSNSVPPSNPAGIRIDSKRRRRLMEKRMAMGHRADDHEEQTQYQQSM